VINGGFWKKDDSKPAQVPSVIISVDNIKQAMQDVIDAGGEILGQPDNIPGVGLYVSFNDTEGNRVSLLQPEPMQIN
jgi:predicted enzyme related to lactoylglutathione lyase